MPIVQDSFESRRLPFGLFAFDVVGAAPGEIAQVDLTLPAEVQAHQYFKQDAWGNLVPFPFNGQTGAIVDGNQIHLFLQDGGRGDADRTADGVIRDPGAPSAGVLSVAPGRPHPLDGWNVAQYGGRGAGAGSVVAEHGALVLKEGNSFLVEARREVVIPNYPSVLELAYQGVFDTSNGFINDAFEVALLGADGHSVVPTIRHGRDSFFNRTEGETAALGDQTIHQPDVGPGLVAGVVQLDISELLPGSTYTLVLRLVNNDGDAGTEFRLRSDQLALNMSPISGDEGGSVSLVATLPGIGTTVGYAATIDWGDGTDDEAASLDLIGDTLRIDGDHVYADDDAEDYEVTVKLFYDNVEFLSQSTSATIENVAPVLGFIQDVAVNIEEQPAGQERRVSFSTTFSDVGLLDTHTYQIDWGDGTSASGALTTVSGSGTVGGTKDYAANGTYVVTVTVSDNDGGIARQSFVAYVSGDIVAISEDSYVELDLAGLEVEAGYNNELGMFITEDALGTIRDANGDPLLPGDPGYAFAAITHSSSRVILPRAYMTETKNMSGPSREPRNYRILVEEGSFIAFYAIQDQTTQWWIANNPNNVINPSNYKQVAFFTAREANPDDGYSHFRISTLPDGGLRYGHEDLLRGIYNVPGQNSDEDYDDLNFTIRINPVSQSSTPKFYVDNGTADRQLFFYNERGHAVQGVQELASANSHSMGLTSDYQGASVWAIDQNRSIYQYTYDPEQHDLASAAVWTPKTATGGNLVEPTDIGTDGDGIWVVDKDGASSRIYYYASAASITPSGDVDATSSFALHNQNTDPSGLAVDDQRAFVTDLSRREMFVYSRTTGAYLGRWSLDPGNTTPTDVTTEPTGPGTFSNHLYVVDKSRGEVFVYPNSTGWIDNGNATNATLLPKNSTWKYLVTDQPPAADWHTAAYDASGWATGQAPLGYGTTVNTEVGFGGNANNKNRTTYFRTEFNVTEEDYSAVTLSLRRDDGAVVYINGVEVARHNMPFGDVDYDTTSRGNNTDVASYHNIKISPAALAYGDNVIAVEVHKWTTSGSSSNQLIMDAELKTYVAPFRTASTVFSLQVEKQANGDTISLNPLPEGIADPPDVQVFAPAADSTVASGATLLVTGQALPDTAPVSAVTVNGRPVDAIDASGNLFAAIHAASGPQTVQVVARDLAQTSSSVQVAFAGVERQVRDGIDFSVVHPAASVGVSAEYAQTSFNERTDSLYADARLVNGGTFSLRGPVLVGITNISHPLVSFTGADGFTPGGIPYLDATDYISEGDLEPGANSDVFSLRFHNPQRVPFAYDLVLFGAANRPPAFVTPPRVEVVAGKLYDYASDAFDPDGDALTYRLAIGPEDMTIDPQTGAIDWQTGSGDAGNHSVLIEVSDGRGGIGQQRFVISVLDQAANRPPRFVSTPVIDAYVNQEYQYPSLAIDPDDDDLTYSLTDGPSGMTIDAETGEIVWTPPPELVGQTVGVTIQADDGHSSGSAGVAEQTYLIYVHPQPGNAPPVIISRPRLTHMTPDFVGPASGDVEPLVINLELGEGQIHAQTVSITLPPPGSGGGSGFADIILIVDESGSMMEHAWIADMVQDLDDALLDVGIGTATGFENRFGLVGFGAYNPAPRSIPVGAGNALFGTSQELAAKVDQLEVSGDTEDGYAAIMFALSNYTFREDAAVNLILLTDEDRDDINWGGGQTYQDVFDELDQCGAMLNVIVDAQFATPPTPVARLGGSGTLTAGNNLSLHTSGTTAPSGRTIVSYSWDLDGDGTFGDGSYTASSLNIPWATMASNYGFEPGGSYVVAVKVTDNMGASDVATFAVNVRHTSLPEARIGGDATISAGNSLSLNAFGSNDPDGGSITAYTWDLDDDGVFGDGSYNTNSISIPWATLAGTYGFEPGGSYVVAVKVTDDEGQTDIAQWSVNVRNTSLPEARLTGSAFVDPGNNVSLNATSSDDPDGGSIVSYTWDLDGDGTFGDGSYTSGSLNLNWTTLQSFGFTADDTFVVAVKVTDDEGQTDVAEFAVNVRAATPVIVTELSGPTWIPAYSQYGLDLDASWSYIPLGGDLTYSWDFDGDGTFGDGSVTSAWVNLSWNQLVNYGFELGGRHVVTVKATDEYNNSATASLVVNVGGPRPPEAVLDSYEGSSVAMYSDLYVSAEYSYDPDNAEDYSSTGIVSYGWDLDGDGVFGDGVGSGGAITSGWLSLSWSQLMTLGFEPGGSYTIAVKVTDDEGDTDIGQYTFNIDNPRPPEAVLDSYADAVIDPQSSLYLSAAGSYDPDNVYAYYDTGIVSYSWDPDGDGVFGDGGITGNWLSYSWSQLLALGFEPGENHAIAVKVTDDEGDTDTALWTIKLLDDPFAFGLDSDMVAYQPGGQGSYLVQPGGAYYSGFGTTEQDYIELAWDTGGAAWDIMALRGDYPTPADPAVVASFTAAFVDVKKDEILQQLAYIDVDLVASDDNLLFDNLTGVRYDALLGTEIEFDIELTGDGHGQAFELQFVNPTTSTILGAIPVTVNNNYFYLVQAIDPDGDEITYTLVDGPDGAVMDPQTARIQWNPTAPGDYCVPRPSRRRSWRLRPANVYRDRHRQRFGQPGSGTGADRRLRWAGRSAVHLPGDRLGSRRRYAAVLPHRRAGRNVD